MEWTRSETVALAASNCNFCHGIGLVTGKRGRTCPCNCVLRAIFRVCYARFRHCVNKEKHLSRVTLSLASSRSRRMTWSRKDEEYIADFYLVTKRHLTESEFRLFKFHYLLGADWRLCCRRLNIERGNFFHAVYRIQQKLGRVYRELKPYGLFPIDEYFNDTVRLDPEQIRVRPFVPPHGATKGIRPLTPPMLIAA